MKHIEVVAAVIVDGNRILCVQRPESKFDYISRKFEFPGGKIESGETQEEALRREISEELHMSLSSMDKFISVDHTYPDFSITMHCFICQSEDYNFQLEEHIDYRWKKREDIRTLDWAAADIPVVEALITMEGSGNRTLDYYNQNYKQLSERYESASVDNVHNSLLSCFQKGDRLLELGCGSGRDASWMTTQGVDVNGIDGSKQMVEEATKIHPELHGKLSQGILPEILDSMEGPFNGIYSIAVLMHLSPSLLPEIFRKIHSLLVSGGKFFFSVSLERDDIDDNGLDAKGRYFSSQSQKEWIQLSESCGYRNIEASVNGDGLNRDGILWLTLILEKL